MLIIMNFLKGKKTYFIATIGVLVFISARLGFLTPEVEKAIYEALGIGALFTLRAAIKKVE